MRSRADHVCAANKALSATAAPAQLRPRCVRRRDGTGGDGSRGPDCASGRVDGADDDGAAGSFHDAHHLEPQTATAGTPDMVL